MKKHLIKKYNIKYERKKMKFTFIDMKTICVQFFYVENQYKAFIVRAKKKTNDEIAKDSLHTKFSSSTSFFSHAIIATFDFIIVKLKQKYERNQ